MKTDEELAREFVQTRASVTERAIKRGLQEGWRYVYVWERCIDSMLYVEAGMAPPGDVEGLLAGITRYELGDGRVLDRTEEA